MRTAAVWDIEDLQVGLCFFSTLKTLNVLYLLVILGIAAQSRDQTSVILLHRA